MAKIGWDLKCVRHFGMEEIEHVRKILWAGHKLNYLKTLLQAKIHTFTDMLESGLCK